MTHRHVTVGTVVYDFVPADPPLIATRDWCIASAQLTDDLTGDPITAPFRVRVVLPGAEDEIAQDGRRARRAETAIAVKHGRDGTFALVGRPWLRFTPFGAPPLSVTVAITAEGFTPARIVFPIAYDQRTMAVAALQGNRQVTLNTAAGLTPGQTLLFGPAATPQFVRIRSIAGNQVTLEAGLLNPQAFLDPVYPDAFATPAPAPIALRREPIWIAGRVVTCNTSTNESTAIINAPVWVSDFWRTRADRLADPANGAMTDPVVAQRQFAIALTPGALAARAIGANAGTLALPSAGDDRTLTRPATAGESRVDVTVQQNLQVPPAPLANRLIFVEPENAAAAEYHTVLTLQPAGGATEPVAIGTELSLANNHRPGALVVRITAPAVLPPAPRLFRDGAAAGDRCVFLDSIAGFVPPGAVRFTGGGAPDEFQRFALLETRSDGEGYFRLPPVQRMAHLVVTVDDGGGNQLTFDIEPPPGQREIRLDVQYRV